MNTLDIILTVIAAFLLIRGLWRGLIMEVASLGGFVLGFYLAGRYADQATPYVNKAIADPGWSAIVAYALVFIATIVVVTTLARVIKKLLNLTFASWLDHLAGGLLGLLQAAFLGCLIFLILSTFLPDARFMRESRIAPYLENIIVRVEQQFPRLKDFREQGEAMVPGRTDPAPGGTTS